MIRARVVLLLLIVALAFPSGLVQSTSGGKAGSDLLLAQAAPSSATAAAPMASLAAKKNQRSDRSAREHKRERRQKDRPRDRRSAGNGRGPAQTLQNAQLEATCDGPGMIFLPKSGLCTHGPDPAPPDVDVTRRAAPLPRAAARAAAEALTCDGNGQSGPRIQVLYVRASDVTSRYTDYLASFRAWTAETDAIMQESAEAAGGNRRFRFVTTPGCAIDIQQVTLSSAGDDSVDNTIVELKAQGFARTDRYYLVFVDTVSAGICGIATGSGDDSPGQANWNNYGPGFARVDAGCWTAYVAAHELMHNLGAVNDSAPNSTGFGHCIDDYDVMCYSDPPNRPAMRIDCPDEALEDRYDCGHDDYFNPNPDPGSYLASNWNTANNRFLVGGGNGADDEGSPPTVTWVSPTGNDGVHEVATGTLTLEATATDGSGINRVEFSRYDRSEERFITIAVDRSAPYTVDLAVADLQPGFNQIYASASDGARNFTIESIRVKRTEPNPRPPTVTWISPVGNGQTHRASAGAVALEAAAADTSGIDEVQFWRYDGQNETWIKIASDKTAPYTASQPVATLRAGRNYLIADAYDRYANRTTEPIWIERTAPAAPVAITAPGRGAKVKANASVPISATVSDALTGVVSVEFRVCGGGSCAWNAATPLTADTGAPYGASWKAPKSGSFTFLAQVTHDDGSDVSDPVTVSVQKAKKKKQKKR